MIIRRRLIKYVRNKYYQDESKLGKQYVMKICNNMYLIDPNTWYHSRPAGLEPRFDTPEVTGKKYYCVSRNSCPFLYNMGRDLLDMQ